MRYHVTIQYCQKTLLSFFTPYLFLYFINLPKLLTFCYALSSATLRRRVSIYFTPSLESALDHAVRMFWSSTHFTHLVEWCFLIHYLISIFGCHMQERHFICARGLFPNSTLAYMYMITHALLVQQFSLRTCYDSWWFILFFF